MSVGDLLHRFVRALFAQGDLRLLDDRSHAVAAKLERKLEIGLSLGELVRGIEALDAIQEVLAGPAARAELRLEVELRRVARVPEELEELCGQLARRRDERVEVATGTSRTSALCERRGSRGSRRAGERPQRSPIPSAISRPSGGRPQARAAAEGGGFFEWGSAPARGEGIVGVGGFHWSGEVLPGFRSRRKGCSLRRTQELKCQANWLWGGSGSESESAPAGWAPCFAPSTSGFSAMSRSRRSRPRARNASCVRLRPPRG